MFREMRGEFKSIDFHLSKQRWKRLKAQLGNPSKNNKELLTGIKQQVKKNSKYRI